MVEYIYEESDGFGITSNIYKIHPSMEKQGGNCV